MFTACGKFEFVEKMARHVAGIQDAVERFYDKDDYDNAWYYDNKLDAVREVCCMFSCCSERSLQWLRSIGREGYEAV